MAQAAQQDPEPLGAVLDSEVARLMARRSFYVVRVHLRGGHAAPLRARDRGLGDFIATVVATRASGARSLALAQARRRLREVYGTTRGIAFTAGRAERHG
jgi:hypothetical protein